MKRALTIAGSDSGGGAGIQADLKTFSALGVFGTSALTAITAQNTTGVFGVQELPPEFVGAQIDAVMNDIGTDAAKTGMLFSAEIIAVVADMIRRHNIPNLVVDPVMVAKSGDALLRRDAVRALIEQLLPLALVVTPNIPEAEEILGRTLNTEDEIKLAASEIGGMGPKYVVIKGGHREGDAVDVVWDGRGINLMGSPRFATRNTHGTGCTFSAAIAAHLARGLDPMAAISAAKRYITEAIANAFQIGQGQGPVHHLYRFFTSEGEPASSRKP